MKLLGIATVASAALVVIKLAGFAVLSWWVVFAPMLVVGGIGLSTLCIVAVLALIVNHLIK